DTQNETAVTLGSGGRVVVAFNDTLSLLHNDVIGWASSADGGDSFTDQGAPPFPPRQGGGSDPVLARSNSTGTIFLINNDGTLNEDGTALIEVGVNVHRSVDNGATFNTPVNGATPLDPEVNLADKPWIAVDNFPGPGQGNVYVVWR